MAICAGCKRSVYVVDPEAGICPQCAAEWDAEDPLSEEELTEALKDIIVTTETAHNLPVSARIDIVTAEVVYGMHFFKDLAASMRDVFGGRSQVLQTGLRDARKAAISELRQEAYALGADAVVGINLAYSQISGDSRNMLILVASGTAVKLAVNP